MADIFISYARADRDRIEKLANALEAAGFSVWWDRHLEGGAEFAKDIEAAIKDAIAVIVAWSATAADSHWVRDEAVHARDHGKMIPIRLDATEPPMGFRQVQAIDFADWNGKADAPAFAAVKRALAKRFDPDREAAPAPEAPAKKQYRRPGVAASLAGGLAFLSIVAAVLFFAFRPADPGDSRAAAKPDETSSMVATEDKSIAVLPFVALSSDQDDAFFGDGLAEELLNSLAQFPDLKVAARTSAFSFAGENIDLRDVGEQLGVAHVLEGSVRRAGDKVRVTAQLIRASDGFHLWSETYERDFTDVFAIQDEVVRNISRVLQVRLGVGGGAGRAAGAGVDPQAYEQYLRGLALWGARDTKPFARRQAIAAFQRATAFDPDFVDAWAALGHAGALSGGGALGFEGEEYIQEIETALDRALSLDPDNPVALAGKLSWSRTRAIDVEAGEALAARLLKNAPNLASSHYSAANFWTFVGNVDAATAAYERAIALDPLNMVMRRVYAEHQIMTGETAAGMAFFDRCVKESCLDSNGHIFHAVAASVIAGEPDRYPELTPRLFTMLKNMPADRGFMIASAIGYVVADAAGKTEEADDFRANAVRTFISDADLDAVGLWGPALAPLLPRADFFKALERGLSTGEVFGSPFAMAPFFGVNPYPEEILRDPRYQAIWKRPGMAELAAARRANGWTHGLPIAEEAAR